MKIKLNALLKNGIGAEYNMRDLLCRLWAIMSHVCGLLYQANAT